MEVTDLKDGVGWGGLFGRPCEDGGSDVDAEGTVCTDDIGLGWPCVFVPFKEMKGRKEGTLC